MPAAAAIIPAVISAAGAVGGSLAAKGKTPNLPEVRTVDPYQTQTELTQSNIAGLPGAAALGTGVNAYNQMTREGQMQAALPGARGAQSSAMANLMRYLSSDPLSDLEKTYVGNRVAGQAARLGVGGRGIQDAWKQGSLIREASGLQRQATMQAPSLISGLAAPWSVKSFDITSQFPTYTDVLQAKTGTALGQTQRDWYNTMFAAAPSAGGQALAQGIGALTKGLAGLDWTKMLQTGGNSSFANATD